MQMSHADFQKACNQAINDLSCLPFKDPRRVRRGKRREQMKRKPKTELLPRYSGKDSRDFWIRINALKANDRGEAYTMGVLLQNLESTVLSHINDLEKRGEL
jgi:hypothetical protein